MNHPIAVELLRAERDRALVDHYEDGLIRGDGACAGCDRALAIRREIEDLTGMLIEPGMLRLYRSRHTIKAIPGMRPGIGPVSVCATDRIRVHAVRPMGRWRHDVTEIEALT